MKDYAKTEDLIMLTTYITMLDDKSYLRKKLAKFIDDELNYANTVVMSQAVKDGHTNETEIKDLMKKYKVERKDISEIFKHLYEKGITMDSPDPDTKVIMVTVKDSGIWRMRHYMKKRFGTTVMTSEEAIKTMMENEEWKDKKDAKDNADYIG